MVIATRMTAAELELWPDGEGKQELIRGTLIEMSPPGGEHGRIAAVLGGLLWSFVRDRHLGVVMVESGFVLERDPDTVCGPDVAFVRAERLPDTGVPQSFWEGSPDLAVEILSSSERRAQIARKMDIYRATGTRLIWCVDPRRRTVSVHAPGRPTRVLSAGDSLDGEEVLPGLVIPLSEVFG